MTRTHCRQLLGVDRLAVRRRRGARGGTLYYAPARPMAVPSRVSRARVQGVAVGRRLALASAPPVLPSAEADFEAQRTLPRRSPPRTAPARSIGTGRASSSDRASRRTTCRRYRRWRWRPRSRTIRGGGFDAYARALESAGQELARWGMPEPRAMAALAALLESSVRYVGGAPGDVAALVRLAFAGSLALTTGYARRAHDELAQLRRAGAAAALARPARRDRAPPRGAQALPRHDRHASSPRLARRGSARSSTRPRTWSARPSSRCGG